MNPASSIVKRGDPNPQLSPIPPVPSTHENVVDEVAITRSVDDGEVN